MIMEGNMKKEKLFKNKKRGQGFAEYALLAGGMIIIIGFAVVALRTSGLFDNVARYIRCLLRVATASVGAGADVGMGGCNACLRNGGTYSPITGQGDFCN
jgi:hypothetical protein